MSELVLAIGLFNLVAGFTIGLLVGFTVGTSATLKLFRREP